MTVINIVCSKVERQKVNLYASKLKATTEEDAEEY